MLLTETKRKDTNNHRHRTKGKNGRERVQNDKIEADCGIHIDQTKKEGESEGSYHNTINSILLLPFDVKITIKKSNVHGINSLIKTFSGSSQKENSKQRFIGQTCI